MANYILSFALLIVGIITPSLWSQGKFMYSLEQNNPSKLQRRQATHQFELKLADKVKNCEHLHIDEASRWAILSCDPSRDYWNPVMGFLSHRNVSDGGLYLYDFAGEHGITDGLAQIKLMDYPLANTDFHPLGLEYHAPSQQIFVVNLARSGTRIEVFKLYPEEQAATYIRSIRHVHLPAPNSIYALSATELYVTNDHYFPYVGNALLSQIETYGGLPIAPISYVDISEPEPRVFTVARQAFSNGIARLNDTAFAVASTITGTVRLYEVDGTTKKWIQRESIAVPMLPDNLSVDENGVLYVTGHGHAFSMTDLAKTRPDCHSEHEKKREKCRKATSTSVVATWTREKGVEVLYLDDAFSAACTAAKDVKSGIGLVSTLYGDGILTWKE